MESWYFAIPITIFVLIAISSCLYRRRMYQLWQQRQQTIAVTRVPRGQCQRVIITTANYPHQQGEIPPQQVSTVNTVSSGTKFIKKSLSSAAFLAFEPPPSYDDAARNYPKYNDGSQFPSHPPGYGAPQASVPVAGQTSGFTNNAFH